MKEKFFDLLERFGSKITEITALNAIKNAFIYLMPIIIGGSFATLLNNVLCSPKNGLAQFKGFEFLEQLGPIFSGVNYATMNFIAVFLAGVVAVTYCKAIGKKDVLLPATIAVASFVTLLPNSVSTVTETGETVVIANALASKYTSAQGMFVALITGILATKLFLKLLDVKKLKIKMPETVPTGVAKSFEVIIPATLTFFIVGIINYIFISVVGENICDVIYTVFQEPLMIVMQSPFGFLALCLFSGLLWVVGIHGQQVIKAVRDPLLLATLAANLDAFEAGEALPNIVTLPFWNTYMTIGGSGCTLGLLIAIFMVSKRDDYKEIAKLSIVPSLFGINEPVIFGLPIVLNPTMLIPFVITPLITGFIAYVALSAGIGSPASILVPFTVPPLMNAFISTAGSFGAVAIQIVCILVSVVIYFPFVKAANKEKISTME